MTSFISLYHDAVFYISFLGIIPALLLAREVWDIISADDHGHQILAKIKNNWFLPLCLLTCGAGAMIENPAKDYKNVPTEVCSIRAISSPSVAKSFLEEEKPFYYNNISQHFVSDCHTENRREKHLEKQL